jgi:creatinine amidohydrolase
MRLAHIPWTSFEVKKAYLPIGSFEQHGPHLPLNTDTLIAKAVAAGLAKKTGGFMGPSICCGISSEHMSFQGTITLRADTLLNYLTDIILSLKRHGISDIVIVNGHGGNNKALSAIEELAKIVNVTTLLNQYDHAGEVETSLIMHLKPALVIEEKIEKHEFRWPGKGEWEDTKDYSETGVLGDPTKASKEKGEKYLNELVDAAYEIVKD